MSQSTLPSLVEIEEKSEESFKCPQGVEEQLKRAAFSQKSATEFVKRRTSLLTGKERDVVSVYIEDDTLRIEVRDIVGVVDLTPDSRLQIQPKIGWREILQMYLSVYNADRSVEHHGIPIEDFLADDIDLDDIFIIVALNWYNSLKPLHTHGFLREFETKRYDAVSGRGRIDIERSLQNFDRGIPKQHYVQKNINYSVPENEIIHKAGQVLVRLFQRGVNTHNISRYFEIFSDIMTAVDDLEQRGIDSAGIRPSEYRSVSVSNLPRQRSYYRDAIQISKMILSSTSGQSLADGAEELTVDYIIDMENLFENFTQVTLVEELDKIINSPFYTTEKVIEIEDKPTIRPYTDSTQSNYQPDHVLRVDDEVAAVLDSKYYSADNDPSSFSHSRTSMFAYAFLLETDQMAFLCPSGRPRIRQLEARSGEVEIVTPEGTFTIEKYRRELYSYLRKIIGVHFDEDGLLADLKTYKVAYSDPVPNDVEELVRCETLHVSYPGLFARKVLEEAADLSNIVRVIWHVPKENQTNMKNNFKKILENTNDYNIHIPLFLPSNVSREVTLESMDEQWEGEAIQLYGVRLTDAEEVELIDDLGVYPLDWKNDI